MSVGANISVIAVGAILSFATHVHSKGVDLTVIGAVVMVVGVAALVMQLASLARQRELTAVTAQQAAREAAGAVVVRPVENRYNEDGGF